MRLDVAVTWPFARPTRLDVARIMGLLATSLATSETLTSCQAASRHICHALTFRFSGADTGSLQGGGHGLMCGLTYRANRPASLEVASCAPVLAP
jgi:hypothetical protein